MAAIAFGQREGYCPVTQTALLTLQNLKHGNIVGSGLGLEKLIVAVGAIEPERMFPVRETHDWHATFEAHQNILIKHPNLGAWPQGISRVDLTFLERFQPADHVSGGIRRQL